VLQATGVGKGWRGGGVLTSRRGRSAGAVVHKGGSGAKMAAGRADGGLGESVGTGGGGGGGG
jgi:hypothetical protein